MPGIPEIHSRPDRGRIRRWLGLRREPPPAPAAPPELPILTAEPVRGVAPALRSGIIPGVHLRTFAQAQHPVVAICGDSTSTDPLDPSSRNPDMTAPCEMWWQLLKRRIRQDNPDRAITFVNRSIGATTWASPLTAMSYGPDWYADHGRVWLTYVQEAEPDLLFLAFGANDAGGFQPDSVRAVLRAIAAWPKRPDIVLVTPRASSWTTPEYAFCRPSQQATAAWLRQLAASGPAIIGVPELGPLGLIDLSRQQQQAEDGIDPERQYLRTVETGRVASGGKPQTMPMCDGDFALALSWQAGPEERFNGVSIGDIHRNSYVNIIAPPPDSAAADTRLHAAIFCGSREMVAGFYASEPVDLASVRIDIAARNECWLVLCNGRPFVEASCPRLASPFQPMVAPFAAGLDLTINSYQAGVAIGVERSLRRTDTFGAGNGPIGGNGLNHPSGVFLATVDAAVVEATRFA